MTVGDKICGEGLVFLFTFFELCFSRQRINVLLFRLKLSPSPSTQVTVSRMSGSSSSRTSKRKRAVVETQDLSEMGTGEEQLLVSEEATASGAVTISPTDMDGTSVTLKNESEQVSLLVFSFVGSAFRVNQILLALLSTGSLWIRELEVSSTTR